MEVLTLESRVCMHDGRGSMDALREFTFPVHLLALTFSFFRGGLQNGGSRIKSRSGIWVSHLPRPVPPDDGKSGTLLSV